MSAFKANAVGPLALLCEPILAQTVEKTQFFPGSSCKNQQQSAGSRAPGSHDNTVILSDLQTCLVGIITSPFSCAILAKTVQKT